MFLKDVTRGVAPFLVYYFILNYRNNLKYSDRQVWAKFAILSACFGLVTLWKNHIVQIYGNYSIFWVSEFFDFYGICNDTVQCTVIYHSKIHHRANKIFCKIVVNN